MNDMFGWCELLKGYGLRSFRKDATIPFCIALPITILSCVSSSDSFDCLKILLDMGFAILPALVGFFLASYTMVLSFLFSDRLRSKTHSEDGRNLVKGLNSNFAMFLTFACLALVLYVIVGLIIHLEFSVGVCVSNVANRSAFFTLLLLLLLPLRVAMHCIIDLFNIGQITLTEK